MEKCVAVRHSCSAEVRATHLAWCLLCPRRVYAPALSPRPLRWSYKSGRGRAGKIVEGDVMHLPHPLTAGTSRLTATVP